MKIIFEYEDGTYRIVPHVTLKKIHSDSVENKLIAKYLSDGSDFSEENSQYTAFGYGNEIVRQSAMYIIADDNRLAGFGPHKDKQNTLDNIQYLEKRLTVYRQLMDEFNKIEDLSIQTEKIREETVEELAMKELFEYAIRHKLPPEYVETTTEFVKHTPFGDIVIRKKGKKNVPIK